jgi:predicted nucleic acid-binding protein
VKRYVEETGSDSIRTLLAEGLPATSRLSEVEIVSALARRCREGAFPVEERDRAIRQVREDFRTLSLVELTTAVVEKATALLAGHALRAADALQLGSCLELQERLGLPVPFAVFDFRLMAAARAEGLSIA